MRRWILIVAPALWVLLLSGCLGKITAFEIVAAVVVSVGFFVVVGVAFIWVFNPRWLEKKTGLALTEDGRRKKELERKFARFEEKEHRSELIEKIENRDVEFVEQEDLPLIEDYIHKRLEGFTTIHLGLEDIISRLEQLRNKADTMDIRFIAGSLDDIEIKAGSIRDTMDQLSHKISEFVREDHRRYSTIAPFTERISHESGMLVDLLHRLQDIAAGVDQGIRKIIHAQDEALVSREFNGSEDMARDDLADQVSGDLEKLEGDLIATVGAIKKVYDDVGR